MTEQPTPIPNDRPDIQTELIGLWDERREHGITVYGTALQPFNGRHAIQDALDEAMDLSAYLLRLRREWDELTAAARDLLQSVDGISGIGDEMLGTDTGPLLRERADTIRQLLAGLGMSTEPTHG